MKFIPFDLDGKNVIWSYVRSPRWNRASDSLLGVSKESWNPLPGQLVSHGVPDGEEYHTLSRSAKNLE